MNNRYKVGIAVALLLLLFNQAFIQYGLKKKEDDAKIINVAGKQRMLSQRINLGFYHGDIQSGLLRKYFTEWQKVNNAFLFGNKEIGIEKTNNKEVEQILTRLIKNVNFAESQLVNAEKGASIEKEKLFKNQSDFLFNMNKAVNLLESDSNQALINIKITEITLMVFSMLVLVLEVFLIYRPINNALQVKLNELKEKNEEVEKNNVELSRLNNSLEEYSFITAHDLSEPVRKISVYTNELNQSINENDKSRTEEVIQILNGSAKRLTDYFNGVLSLNVIDSNKRIIKQKISSLVHQTLMGLNNEFPKVKYELNLKLEDYDEIKFDKNELPTLIHEIIKNSFVYRIESIPLKLTICSSVKGDNFILSFEDNGIGVDMALEHKVFQMFQRLHGRKEYQGNGIGLALCKKIIETSGGEIGFEKGRSTGAKLILKLPLSIL